MLETQSSFSLLSHFYCRSYQTTCLKKARKFSLKTSIPFIEVIWLHQLHLQKVRRFSLRRDNSAWRHHEEAVRMASELLSPVQKEEQTWGSSSKIANLLRYKFQIQGSPETFFAVGYFNFTIFSCWVLIIITILWSILNCGQMKSLKKGIRENWDTMVNIPKMWGLPHPEDTMGSPQMLSLVLLSTS